MNRQTVALLICALLSAVRVSALEVQVKELRTIATVINASVELRDIVPERFKKTLDENGTLHLRIQAELWESRPVWDRLVYPAIVRAFRMTRANVPPNPMPLKLELGNRDRIVATGRYYLHVIATLGTLAERDVDDAGDAVFGRPEESNTLGSFGRVVFRTALQISDYLQSVSAEIKTKRIAGADLLRP